MDIISKIYPSSWPTLCLLLLTSPEKRVSPDERGVLQPDLGLLARIPSLVRAYDSFMKSGSPIASKALIASSAFPSS